MKINRKFRFEFKYHLDVPIAMAIQKDVKKFGMQIDSHATEDDGSYVVSSLYFDTFNLVDYIEKAGGMVRRKKIRLRIYEPFLNNSDFVFLEIKNKYDMMNYKTKIRLDREEAEDVIKKGVSVLIKRKWDDKDMEKRSEIISSFISGRVKPAALVVYDRKAFVNKNKELRITFDSDVKTCRKKNFNTPDFYLPVSKKTTIMEVKFSHFMPFWFKDVITKYNLDRKPFSKYEKSLEEINHFNPIPR